MSTSLDQARKAVIGCQQKIEAYAGFSQTSQQLATIADYLDSQVPLAVEVEQLRIKLAYAESFVSKINALTSQHVDQANEAVRAATMTALCGGPALMGIQPGMMTATRYAGVSSVIPGADDAGYADDKVSGTLGDVLDASVKRIDENWGVKVILTPEALKQLRKGMGDV